MRVGQRPAGGWLRGREREGHRPGWHQRGSEACRRRVSCGGKALRVRSVVSDDARLCILGPYCGLGLSMQLLEERAPPQKAH